MGLRIGLGLVWLGFVGYAFGLAPPDQPDTFLLIQRLSTGDWADINPLIVALFNLMGIWPLAYSALALVDGAGQRLPAWPFVVGSFGLGAFALMPYLVLRSPNPDTLPPRHLLVRLLESRGLGIVLFCGTLALLVYGLSNGDWADFVAQWRTSRFIHVMSLDFCMLALLVPTLLGDDMARRGMQSPLWMALITGVPLLGLSAYLALRPPLPPETVTPPPTGAVAVSSGADKP